MFHEIWGKKKQYFWKLNVDSFGSFFFCQQFFNGNLWFDLFDLVILFWSDIKTKKKIHVGQNIPHNLKFKYKSNSLISFHLILVMIFIFLVSLWFIIADVVIIALVVNLVVWLIQINFFLRIKNKIELLKSWERKKISIVLQEKKKKNWIKFTFQFSKITITFIPYCILIGWSVQSNFILRVIDCLFILLLHEIKVLLFSFNLNIYCFFWKYKYK